MTKLLFGFINKLLPSGFEIKPSSETPDPVQSSPEPTELAAPTNDAPLSIPKPMPAERIIEARLTWDVLKQHALTTLTINAADRLRICQSVEEWQTLFELSDDEFVAPSVSMEWEHNAEIFLYTFADDIPAADLHSMLVDIQFIVRSSITELSTRAKKTAQINSEIALLHKEEERDTDSFVLGEAPKLLGEGRSAYRPVNVSNNFHKGFMYYPVEVVESVLETHPDTGEKVTRENRITVVVRSDRTVQKAYPSDLPTDSITGQRIYRLTDGTLVHTPPRASSYSTWEWESIQNFVEGRDKPADLKSLLHQVHTHLRSRVWLPSESDYWVLSLAAAASYCQSIFDAVPLILLTGPAGTGKSELSTGVTEVSANSVMISQGSAPTIMRMVDESGGLVVVDDLESVFGSGSKRGKERFNEIAQMLKVSYKKSSATRLVTNVSKMRTEILNFFGIKIISNTRGVDRILGSRMLHIHTRHMPRYELNDFTRRTKLRSDQQSSLRNNLHTWAFSHVNEINNTYFSMYGDKTNRDDEIAAPLRVIASMSGDETISAFLEEALELQTRRRRHKEDPEQLLGSALTHLVLEGYREITTSHVLLEMQRQLDPGHRMEEGVDMPSWAKPEWIGRRLREMDVAEGQGARKRLHGVHLRMLRLKRDFVQSILASKPLEQEPVKSALAFCGQCEECPYQPYRCDIAAKRSASSAVD